MKRFDPGVDLTVYVQTPEDTVLSKLDWFRQGGEVSDMQWRDAVGILKVKGSLLDKRYMQEWAKELGVADLLTEGIQEAEAVLGTEERSDRSPCIGTASFSLVSGSRRRWRCGT